jgi:non-ribosomal peptide synthase protein (TIGR01720 family)
LHYGLLKYLSEDAGVRERMRRSPQPQLLFNYLGQFDQVARKETTDAAARNNGSFATEAFKLSERGPRNRRSHVIDINGSISGGSLMMEFTYSRNLHHRETIERLAESFLAHLRALIVHCRTTGTTNFTASDFADFGWNDEDLGDILSAIENVES